MKVVAWLIAVVAVAALAGATCAGSAAAVATPCALVGVAAYLVLAVVHHREHR